MAHSLLESLLAQLDEAVLVCDAEGHVLHANRASQSLLTQHLDWMQARPLDSWLRDREGRLWPVSAASEEKEVLFQDISGKVVSVRVAINPIPVLGTKGWMLVFRDKESASQRLAGLEALAGGIACQMSGPLEQILSSASNALLKDPEEEMASSLRQILEAGQQAAVLKKQLRAITGEGGTKEPLSLGSLVSDCMPLLTSILGDLFEVQLHPSPQEHWIEADEASLRMALIELSEWLGRSSTGPSRVLIEMTSAEGRPQKVVLSILHQGAEGSLANRSALLGQDAPSHLAIVYGIVDQHQGRLLVHSTATHGTRFEFEFPMCSVPDEPLTTMQMTTGNETVFVVDDDPATIEVVSQLLEDQGFSVLTASNGIEASEVIRAKHAQIDFFLTDAVLPGRSGLELISEMKSLSPHMPVLLMSGYPAEFMGGQVRPEIPLLGKPFSPGTLINRLRGLLDEA